MLDDGKELDHIFETVNQIPTTTAIGVRELSAGRTSYNNVGIVWEVGEFKPAYIYGLRLVMVVFEICLVCDSPVLIGTDDVNPG